MKRINSNYYQLLFWSICLVIWYFWVQERIEIFSMFVDEYKNIGYYINTNGQQLGWYLFISIGKLVFSLLTIYHLVPRFGFRGQTFARIIVLMLILVGLEYIGAKSYFQYLKHNIFGDFKIDWNYGFFDVIGVYLVFGFFSTTLVAAKNWLEEYQNLKYLYRSQQAYIQLRKKLDPHFIFNTLNNMYEIAVTSGEEKIQRSLLHLTDTLRYTIESSGKEEVPLSTEISAIKSYIELQKEKFDSKEVELDVNISAGNPRLRISPLILLNYIENAFEHGYESGKPNSISIHLAEKAGQIHLYIKNTNHAHRKNENGGNIKTKKLLNMKYHGKHKLRLDNSENYHILNLWMQVK